MSSLKGEFGGYGLPSKPSDGVRTRRVQAGTAAGSLPRPVNPIAFRNAQPASSERTRRHDSKIPSRLPQSPPPAKSGLAASSSRLRRNQQPRTVPTATVGSSTSHSQSNSGSSSSVLSNESSTKSGEEQFEKKRASTVRSTPTYTVDRDRRPSMSPGQRSMASLDAAIGTYMDQNTVSNASNVNSSQQSSAVDQSPAPKIYPELDRYRNHEHPALPTSRYGADALYKLSTQDLPQPSSPNCFISGSSSQLSAISASPSTKFSESPGPGAYSRDTTPTSMSSQSPGLTIPNRPSNMVKAKQLSPAKTRPPVTRRRAGSVSKDSETTYMDPQGLASVRESLTSSSSNSTVREGDRGAAAKKKPGKMPPPPPSPPPRKSSQKFQSNRSKDTTTEQSPTPSTTSRVKEEIPSSSKLDTTSTRPTRPSRHGTPDMKSHLFEPVPVIQSNLRPRPSVGGRRESDTTIPSAPISPSKSKKSASTSNLPSAAASEHSLQPRKSQESKTSETSLHSSPKPASSPSRFTFFGRKKPSANQAENKEPRKLSRKGPAAGTGHEGYGRRGSVRRRSGSQNLVFNFSGPQQSQESIASGDSFFADRMDPVVIVGGEVVGARNTSIELNRTTSNDSQAAPRSSTDSRSEQGLTATSNNSATSLQPSAMPRSLNGVSNLNRLASASDSDDMMAPNLALRRSLQRLKKAPDSPLRLPEPIKTIGVSAPLITSLDTSVTSTESQLDSDRPAVEDLQNVHPAPRKLRKRSKSQHKWNLFGRSQHNESKKEKAAVSATVTAVEKRPVPFYAMMDSAEHEEDEDLDVQSVLRHAGLYSHSPPKLSLDTNVVNASIPQNLPQSDKQELSSVPGQVSRRPSRLQQVGRIPKVESRGHDKSSRKSFSRPFKGSIQQPVTVPDFYDPDSIAKGRSPPRPFTPLPDLVMDESTLDNSTIPSTNRGSLFQETVDSQSYTREFLSFSPRKYSSGTTGTSSSSSAYGAFATATATAIIPKPSDPPVEDEVWDEYDDLLGDETLKVPQSATSSKGTPFHLETYNQKLTKSKDMESPVVSNPREVSLCSTKVSHSSYCSEDMTERIKAAFKPHASPAAAPSTNEHLTSTAIPPSNDPAESNRRSSGSQKSRYSNDSSSSFDYSSPLAQVNLRVGSMSVSKWLTFGHVLFSDLRYELSTAKETRQHLSRHSILVVDGLGNDDWSFYAAETYPEAQFFNLSPRTPVPREPKKPGSTALLSPPNHHQTQYFSHLDRFPFAEQSFDAVVYRFPVASPESHYGNIISESRRVLRPSGYIELAILDLDLNNMGNRGRRAIRQLKEKIHDASPDNTLGSAADLIVRFLGVGGFSGIKAAKVGIPVASSITQADDKGKSKDGSNRAKDLPSLSEMMKDTSPAADANITKMVTRVGRWWYTRCYEDAAISRGNKDIWADKTLLRECQEQGTSLKLTVCCARAPDRDTSY